MRTTISNLKHFYQCRGFWWYYLIFAMFASQMVLFERESRMWFWFGMINLMAGLGISSLHKEILARPFTYCLPGHRPIPRRIIVSFGVILNLLLPVVILLRKDLAYHDIPFIVMSASSFGLIVYLLVNLSGLIPRDRNLFPVVGVGLIGVILVGTDALDSLALDLPVLLPAVAVILGVVAWLFLRGEPMARKFSGQIAWGFSTPNKAARKKAERTASAKQQYDSPVWIHEFFIKCMESSNHTAIARYIWSDLYLAFAKPLSRWKDVLLVLSLVAIGSAYLSTFTRDVDDANSPILVSIAVVMSLAAMSVRLPLYSNTPPFTPRKQRLQGAVSVAGVMTLLMIVMLFVITAMTQLLQQILPDFFAALPQMQIILLPLACVPAVLIIHVCIKSPSLKPALIILMFFLCAGLLIRSENLFLWMLLTSACTWTTFILIARHICGKRCLVQ